MLKSEDLGLVSSLFIVIWSLLVFSNEVFPKCTELLGITVVHDSIFHNVYLMVKRVKIR